MWSPLLLSNPPAISDALTMHKLHGSDGLQAFRHQPATGVMANFPSLGSQDFLPSSTTHETTSSISLLCSCAEQQPHSGDSLDHRNHPLRTLQLQHLLSTD